MTTKAREIEIDEVQSPGDAARKREGADPFMALLARVMDDVFVIPGTKIRFGLDPLVGLIPGIGDTAGAVVSTVLLIQAAREGVPRIVLARMAMNVLANSALGAVPVLGDVFSVWFKSNVRNLHLLRLHTVAGRRSTGGDWVFVAGLIAAVLVVVVGSFAALVLSVDAVLKLVR